MLTVKSHATEDWTHGASPFALPHPFTPGDLAGRATTLRTKYCKGRAYPVDEGPMTQE